MSLLASILPVVVLLGPMFLMWVLTTARKRRKAELHTQVEPDAIKIPSEPLARVSKSASQHNAKIVFRSQDPTPELVYQIARKLSRSEAFRMVRRMDPTREHAAFTYDRGTGIARSISVDAVRAKAIS